MSASNSACPAPKSAAASRLTETIAELWERLVSGRNSRRPGFITRPSQQKEHHVVCARLAHGDRRRKSARADHRQDGAEEPAQLPPRRSQAVQPLLRMLDPGLAPKALGQD